MIGVLAAIKDPTLFESLVLVGPSARYIDDGDYVGGFSAEQIEELLSFLEENHMGWSAQMAPAIMGNPERPELGEELTNSFCRTDPAIAKEFARVTFLSDNRADLARVKARTLILQCSEDIIAGQQVGGYVQRNIPNSKMAVLKATGHCPNLSAPDEVVATIRDFVCEQQSCRRQRFRRPLRKRALRVPLGSSGRPYRSGQSDRGGLDGVPAR